MSRPWSRLPILLLLLGAATVCSAERLAPRKALGSSSDRRPRIRVATESGLRSGRAAPLTADVASPSGSPSSTPGLLAVLGGVLIHLACGTMYCWGNLIAYAPSSLKYWDPATAAEGALPDAALVLPLILVSQMLGMPLGPLIERQLGPRLTALLGACMIGAGTFFSSYYTALRPFILSYSVLFGLGVGVAYQMPFMTGARWFPAKKGMVTGAIISGMGAAAFLFNMLSTKFINPDAINAIGGFFPDEIYARWPELLRLLGKLYFSLAFVGALLQVNPPNYVATYPLLDKLTGRSKPKTKAAVSKALTAPRPATAEPPPSPATADSAPPREPPPPRPPAAAPSAAEKAWREWLGHTKSAQLYSGRSRRDDGRDEPRSRRDGDLEQPTRPQRPQRPQRASPPPPAERPASDAAPAKARGCWNPRRAEISAEITRNPPLTQTSRIALPLLAAPAGVGACHVASALL